jgi:DNA-binding response OmpR family regulator
MDTRKKILIADDEDLTLDFFELMLSRLGYEVEKAVDGHEALEKVRKNAPDLLLLETVLPVLSGWDVLKTLKADAALKRIPVILFSAIDDVKEEVEAFELGVEDYIRKPFNFSVVLARIRRRCNVQLSSGAPRATVKG